MSYPGYPPNNQGYPGQSGIPGQTGMPGMPGQTGMPGMPGQTGMPGSQPSYSQYPAGNIGQQGYPMPNTYPTGQPSYPQQSPYPQVGQYPPQQPSQYPPQQPSQYPPQQPGQYPPQQPGQYPSQQPGQYPSQQPGQYPPNSGSYVPNPSMYPTSSMPGQYPPSPYQSQATSYPNVQPQSNYPSKSVNPYTQQAGGYGGGSQIPSQASYPPVSSPAHYQPVNSAPAQKKSNPTLRPANPFDAQRDAEILRKAMKGIGTDEKAIIQVLAHRVNSQRQQIAIQFKTMYGKDLIDNLKSELGGKLEDLIVALMTPTYDFLASELHYAVDGIGTCEETIIEIICSASNAEINNIKMAYHKLFGNDLEKDLKGETSGTFRRLLVSLCQGRRSENTHIDVASAQTDAQNLLQAGQLQFGTDESTFNMILCSRSYSQLEQVFLEYHRLTGRDFEDTIKSEFSGDIEKGLRAIVKSVRNKSAYYAKRLHECMDGFGTHDRALIRIVATRCEIDMVDIKNAYMSMYGKSLEADIASDTSGDYKKCLTALVVG